MSLGTYLWILWQCTILCKVIKLWQKWQKIVTLSLQKCEDILKSLSKYFWFYDFTQFFIFKNLSHKCGPSIEIGDQLIAPRPKSDQTDGADAEYYFIIPLLVLFYYTPSRASAPSNVFFQKLDPQRLLYRCF